MRQRLHRHYEDPEDYNAKEESASFECIPVIGLAKTGDDERGNDCKNWLFLYGARERESSPALRAAARGLLRDFSTTTLTDTEIHTPRITAGTIKLAD
jgi:hypothetical protein